MTKKNFSVRLAEAQDADAIGTIHMLSWKSTYAGIVQQAYLDKIDLKKRIASAVKRIKNPETDCFVLFETSDQKIVGFAEVGPCREKNVDLDAELYAIYLLKDYQGSGGGKLLFEAAVQSTQLRKFSRLMVSVLEQNISSRKFYERMGGKLIGADHVDIEQHRYITSTYLWNLKLKP